MNNNIIDKMNNKYYIVLRDKNNVLRDWKAFADLDSASDAWVSLGHRYAQLTDGEWVLDYKRSAFTNGREWLCLVPFTAELLMEILFDNARLEEDIFSNFFSERE